MSQQPQAYDAAYTNAPRGGAQHNSSNTQSTAAATSPQSHNAQTVPQQSDVPMLAQPVPVQASRNMSVEMADVSGLSLQAGRSSSTDELRIREKAREAQEQVSHARFWHQVFGHPHSTLTSILPRPLLLKPTCIMLRRKHVWLLSMPLLPRLLCRPLPTPLRKPPHQPPALPEALSPSAGLQADMPSPTLPLSEREYSKLL